MMKPIEPQRIHAVTSALCQLVGPSGHEGQVRDHVVGTWSGHGIEAAVDPVGNVLGRVGGSGKRVLLQAHMDEIGFLVRHITDDGFLFLDSGQGGSRDEPERRFMVGQRAQVMSRGEVVAHGAFVAPSGHVMLPSNLKKPMTLSDLFVDVGAKSRTEAEATGIHPGSPVVWEAPTRLLGDRIMSKALDDRLLLGVIELLIERLDLGELNCELWVGATVQEENLLHGAKAMAAHEHFDAVLALDIALAGDIPTVDATEVDNRLGGGPVVVHQDTLVAYDQDLAWALIDAGRAAGLPVQHGMFSNYATDGVAFMGSGSAAVALGPPARYTHTANEVADIRDIAHTVGLLETFVTGP